MPARNADAVLTLTAGKPYADNAACSGRNPTRSSKILKATRLPQRPPPQAMNP